MPDINPAPAPSSTTETRAKTTKPASLDQAAAPTTTDAISAAHFVLQGKGGVGKSLVASLSPNTSSITAGWKPASIPIRSTDPCKPFPR